MGFGEIGFGEIGFGEIGFEEIGFEAMGFGEMKSWRRAFPHHKKKQKALPENFRQGLFYFKTNQRVSFKNHSPVHLI